MNQQRLKELVSYDVTTGIFTNLTDRAGNCKSGSVAGSARPNGYIAITLDGMSYYAHRLAWLYIHGEFPPNDIDHIDQVKSDNRIANLRLATRSENQCNRSDGKRNTSGVRGVTWNRAAGKWMVQVAKGGKNHYGGLFKDIEEAGRAAIALREKMHGEFAVMPRLLGKEAA